MTSKVPIAILTTVLMLAGTFLPLAVMADIEPNGQYEDAEPMVIPGTMNGHINATDLDDIYTFDVTRGKTLNIVAQPDSNLGINLYLYRQDGSKYVEVAAHRASTVGISYGVPRFINFTCNSSAEVYKMYAWVGRYKGEGFYDLSVAVSAQDDADTGTDAGESYATATVLAPGSYKGYVAHADDEDIYKMSLVKGDSIYVTALPEKGLSVNLQLFRESNVSGRLVYEEIAKDKRTGDEGRGQVRHVDYTLNSREPTTNLYIRIYRDQDYGNYTLSVSVVHQNDGASGTDASDDQEHAMNLTATSSSGYLRSLDVVDNYKLQLSDRQQLFINVTPQNTMSVVLTLYVDGKEVKKDKAQNPDLEKGYIRRVNYTMPRTHSTYKAILKVENDFGNGNYTISMSLVQKPADKDPPVVKLTDPLPFTTVKRIRVYDFKGTATDYNEVTKVEISFDQITWFNASLYGDLGVYTWNCTARFAHRGNNTFYIRATDDQGNTGVTGLYVTYREPEEPGFIPGYEAFVLLSVLLVVAVVSRRKN